LTVPYQDTYKYMMTYTGGDASKLNAWVVGIERLAGRLEGGGSHG